VSSHIAGIASSVAPTNQETVMSSRGKKKTTMAKLSRESRLRERRVEKEARKQARREAAASPQGPGELRSDVDQASPETD
jgi:hypothetical protein